MKKSLILLTLALAGCSTHNNTKIGATPDVGFKRHEFTANATVGERINGQASCSEILFIKSSPKRQTYGNFLQPAGIKSPSACVAAAVYDAMSKDNADVLVAPTYTVIRDKFGCLPRVGCLWSQTQVLVNGYSGKLNPR